MHWRKLATTTTGWFLVGYAAARKLWLSTMSGTPRFDVKAFHDQLTTSSLGRSLLYEEQMTSTMTVAQEVLKTEGRAAHGKGFLCEEQTAGIGRRGRDWRSAANGNIYFSFIWAPTTDTTKELMSSMFKLNFAISIATVKAAQAVGVETARIKWPNDVWIGTRKLSGMLVNFDGKTGGVAGVGINVNEVFDTTDAQLPAVSLAQESGEEVARETVLAAFCNSLEHIMTLPMHEVLNLYAEHDMLKGRTVRVYHRARGEDDEKDYDAQVLGFTPSGNLLVKKCQGGEQVALSGEEISVRPQASAE
ncbi:hypothetical protein PTSG_08145 [Salpingoeca rosetta]|uniref:BPL/LPL catalytic domain-containing protein n=1 Tax=Salpingoeca rosetta (strain ATCC 50818 / BSB-021) TaxID=946362 RepID=F2UI45_SALR5|nr:uncharacterized protein PTSG_08145 [Salpingoeca rosetta]EGD76794.1 hypothetical protein PTSG_08145 [Salpingoeca rosetta]|eukprot:XP_004991166.1 hypothetical protein PTSG_08145 [Salpingoeca rosetta]